MGTSKTQGSGAVSPAARVGLAVLLAICLFACGGGSDDGTPAAAPLAVTAFTATPAEVVTGQSLVLAWQTTGARSVDIDQGIGTVDLNPFRVAFNREITIRRSGDVYRKISAFGRNGNRIV